MAMGCISSEAGFVIPGRSLPGVPAKHIPFPSLIRWYGRCDRVGYDPLKPRAVRRAHRDPRERPYCRNCERAERIVQYWSAGVVSTLLPRAAGTTAVHFFEPAMGGHRAIEPASALSVHGRPATMATTVRGHNGMHTQPESDHAPALVAGIDDGAFLSMPAPRLPAHTTPTACASPLVVSAAIHAVAIASIVAALAGTRPAAPSAVVHRLDAAVVLPRVVFLAVPGRGGGGGGGGNRQPAPIRRAERVGRDRATVPIARPLSTTGRTTDVPAPAQQILLDAKPFASGVMEQIGALEGGVGLGTSQGPGSGGGVGEGVGTGVGSGRGPGIGPGSGGGTGGGLYRPGVAVTSPTLLFQVRPSYTNEALLRKIQGTVLLEVIVRANGEPSNIRVIRSLDPGGLDEQAIEAVRQWRFNPGRLAGAPVDVLVMIVVDFSIR